MSEAAFIPQTDEIARVAELLGGERILRKNVRSPLDAHDLLMVGLPGYSLLALIERFPQSVWSTAFEKAVGVSQRTFQRRQGALGKVLSPEQSGRAWKFAEIFAKAIEVMGSEDRARAWLTEPAMALDRRKPIDLMATPAGTELVEDLLVQLEYGVYV